MHRVPLREREREAEAKLAEEAKEEETAPQQGCARAT